MKNLIYPTEEYTKRREFLRKTEVKWRDMSTCCAIPNWGEAICDEFYTIHGQTCGEIAYDLLKANFPGVKLRWRKDEMQLLDHRPPKMFRFPVVGRIFYIDIKSAYWQFYRYLYLDSRYPYKSQKHSLYPLSLAFINRSEQQWKITRNAIIGITRSTQNKWVKGKEVWYQDKYNRFLSPTLWAQLMGILNQIARQMIDYNAVWLNTDGYAFTSEDDYLKALNFFDERGILIGDKGSGLGKINGLCSVHIDGVKNTTNEQGSAPIYHVEIDEIDHLTYWMNNRKDFN